MYDRSLVAEIVEQTIEAIETVQERCTFAKSEDDFIETKERAGKTG